MILPSKHLSQDRALLTVGGYILTFLVRPKTVSSLWEELNKCEAGSTVIAPRYINYEWFLLALDLLYTLGTIELNNGLVVRGTP